MDNKAQSNKCIPPIPPVKPLTFKPFNPKEHIIKPAPIGLMPIRFIYGRYIDIASTPNKDPNTIYFGMSYNAKSNGIFLGDFELTSKIRDVSIFKGDKDINNLWITFINSNNKLQTIKTTVASQETLDNLKQTIIETCNSSLSEIEDKLHILDSSVILIIDDISQLKRNESSIYEHLNIIDSSIHTIIQKIKDTCVGTLVDDLNYGKYNYTVKVKKSGVDEGYKKVYSLYKGIKKQTYSENIEICNIIPKKLEYDSSTYSLNLVSWPQDVSNDEVREMNPSLVNTTTTSLYDLIQDTADIINTSSMVNNRIVFIESTLDWESI